MTVRIQTIYTYTCDYCGNQEMLTVYGDYEGHSIQLSFPRDRQGIALLQIESLQDNQNQLRLILTPMGGLVVNKRGYFCSEKCLQEWKSKQVESGDHESVSG